MKCFFIANIRITDDQEYKKYIEQAGQIFRQYNGEYLSVDNSPVILEGSWDYTRTVLIGFNNTEDFRSWYYSAEYQGILKHRLNGAVCDTILIAGKE